VTSFNLLMHVMPRLMAAFAVIFYISSVAVSVAAQQEIARLGMETVPFSAKFSAFVIVFIQPLTSVVAFLFGAGLLWRLDQMIASNRGEGDRS
jgi:hypothetical protein